MDGAFPGLVDRLVVDSKAMRKLKVNDTLAFVFQTPAELNFDQGGTVDVTWYFHCLNGS